MLGACSLWRADCSQFLRKIEVPKISELQVQPEVLAGVIRVTKLLALPIVGAVKFYFKERTKDRRVSGDFCSHPKLLLDLWLRQAYEMCYLMPTCWLESNDKLFGLC